MNDIRHGKGLARPSDTFEGLVGFAAIDALNQSRNGFRLITRGGYSE